MDAERKILALDCAQLTGWAFGTGKGKLIESGVQNFTKRRGETNGTMFLRFRKWLCNFIEENGPVEILAYERAHFRGGAATEVGVGLQTRAMEAAAEFNCAPFPVHTTELKKFATGKGNASKEEVIAYSKTVIGRDPLDDNEADAIAIFKYAAQEVGY